MEDAELERRVDRLNAEYEREQAMTPAEREAWKIIEDLCEDPRVWATHGLPGEAKLARIAERIAQSLAKMNR